MKNLKKLGLVAGLATLMSFGAEAQSVLNIQTITSNDGSLHEGGELVINDGNKTTVGENANAWMIDNFDNQLRFFRWSYDAKNYVNFFGKHIMSTNGFGVGTSAIPRSVFETRTEGIECARFNVFNTFNSTLGWGTTGIGFNLARKDNGSWESIGNTYDNGGSAIYGDIYGNLNFICKKRDGGNTMTYTDAQINASKRMVINQFGHVLISDFNGNFADNAAASLGVNGLIYANGVKVSLPVNNVWPDYVFKKDYKLRPLAEVEQFIAANNHLPDVPSEAAVKENGIDVANMDAVLLRKVEELTLYMIQLQKDNLELKAKLEALSK